MARIRYDEQALNFISIFESLTGAKVKDCMIDDNVLLIIEKGNMGLAIGKGGSNLKRVERTLKKTIKIIEFDDNVEKFILNYVYPISNIQVTKEDKNIIIKGNDKKTRAFLIGREKSNLKKMISIVKRYFDISDISVI